MTPLPSDGELLAKTDANGRPLHFPIHKWGISIPISVDLLLGDRFPPYANETVHPVTDEERAAHKAYKKRFKKARRKWNRIVREGVEKRWATWGGYEEDPSVLDLEQRTEYEWLETPEEYRARLTKLAVHNAETGEWLERPRETWFEKVQNQMLDAMQNIDDDTP